MYVSRINEGDSVLYIRVLDGETLVFPAELLHKNFLLCELENENHSGNLTLFCNLLGTHIPFFFQQSLYTGTYSFAKK
jgi:hypothetical protein